MRLGLSIVLSLFLVFGSGSCICESYILQYSVRDAVFSINDNVDYNEDSTELVQTLWKPADSLVLGDSIRIGFVLLYDYSHDVETNTCDPEYAEFTDSVLGINIYTVYPLNGIDAGASVMEAGGWGKNEIDSIIEFINTPFYPANGAFYLKLDKKATEKKVQFRAIIQKARSEDIELYTEELIWE